MPEHRIDYHVVVIYRHTDAIGNIRFNLPGLQDTFQTLKYDIICGPRSTRRFDVLVFTSCHLWTHRRSLGRTPEQIFRRFMRQRCRIELKSPLFLYQLRMPWMAIFDVLSALFLFQLGEQRDGIYRKCAPHEGHFPGATIAVFSTLTRRLLFLLSCV